MSNKDKTSSNSMLFFNYFGEGIDDSKFAPGRYLMTVKPPAKSTSSMPKSTVFDNLESQEEETPDD